MEESDEKELRRYRERSRLQRRGNPVRDAVGLRRRRPERHYHHQRFGRGRGYRVGERGGIPGQGEIHPHRIQHGALCQPRRIRQTD
mgnify:CR=1 FL=1